MLSAALAALSCRPVGFWVAGARFPIALHCITANCQIARSLTDTEGFAARPEHGIANCPSTVLFLELFVITLSLYPVQRCGYRLSVSGHLRVRRDRCFRPQIPMLPGHLGQAPGLPAGSASQTSFTSFWALLLGGIWNAVVSVVLGSTPYAVGDRTLTSI